MTRAIVSVATTPRYRRGMERLRKEIAGHSTGHTSLYLHSELPAGCPAHETVPYAFKAYALAAAARSNDLLLWCDASIMPIRSLEPLWEKIENDGVWIADNGWKNAQWCADSWYADCFPGVPLEKARDFNRFVPHVVATTFGLNVRSKIGASILEEYFRLASETPAFRGPWWNSAGEREDYRKHAGAMLCGPPEVLGHRHDQSCLSIIAYRHGVELTTCPDVFAYSKRRADGSLHVEDQDERTVLVADGSF